MHLIQPRSACTNMRTGRLCVRARAAWHGSKLAAHRAGSAFPNQHRNGVADGDFEFRRQGSDIEPPRKALLRLGAQSRNHPVINLHDIKQDHAPNLALIEHLAGRRPGTRSPRASTEPQGDQKHGLRAPHSRCRAACRRRSIAVRTAPDGVAEKTGNIIATTPTPG